LRRPQPLLGQAQRPQPRARARGHAHPGDLRRRRGGGVSRSGWDAWDASDWGRRVSEQVLDSGTDAMHSALVPPGALHHRVTAALANWQLDDAEELPADVEAAPPPHVSAG